MRTPYTIGVGWLLTLVATLLLCISGLYWANVRTMNASIDRVIQETFDGVMRDVGQALQSNPQALTQAQCALTSQQMLERTHAQLEPVLRVSVARGGRIWCDSETTAIGTAVPDTWPQAPAVGQRPQVFKTEQLTGGVLALSPAPNAMSLWVFVTPFKDDGNGMDAMWGLSWLSLMTTMGLVACICVCALWLLKRMQNVFKPECEALVRLKTSPASAASADTPTHDLTYWAAQELLTIEREQDELAARMERT
jgi:hypothetical protein